jgi:Sulfotransferase domain
MQRFLGRVRERIVNDSLRVDKAVRSTLGQIHFEDNHDYRNTIVLAGSGRGGTTWIAEIINYANEYRFIFEPFQPEHVGLVHEFRSRQYLRPSDEASSYLDVARTVLSGRFRHPWTDQYNRRFQSTRRLVKDIRVNLILKWMQAHFPEIPIVLLLRHPCAVVASRLSLEWGTELSVFLEQPQLMADWLEPYRSVLSETSDPFERHILRWCVETWIPLKQFRTGEIHVAFYEEFCEEPERAVTGLFQFLRRPVNEQVFAQLKKPSSQTRKRKSAIMFDGRLTDTWTKNVTPAQSRRAQELLALFGLDRIYTEDPLPNTSSVRTLPLA